MTVRGRDVNIVSGGVTKIATRTSTCIRMSGVFISVTSVFYSARKCRQDFVKNVAELKYRSGRRYSCHCAGHEGVWGSRRIAPLILNLGTRRGCGQPHAPAAALLGNEPWYLLGLRPGLGPLEKTKISCLCRDSNAGPCCR